MGRVSLIYSSDYAFATSGGSLGRKKCLNLQLSAWNIDKNPDCANNDWLWKQQSVLTPSSKEYLSVITKYGNTGTSTSAGSPMPIYPVVYLKRNVKISGGSGSSSDPYRLEI